MTGGVEPEFIWFLRSISFVWSTQVKCSRLIVWNGSDGYCFPWTLGFDCFRSKESIEFLVGFCDRYGSRYLLVRDLVGGSDDRFIGKTRLQSRHTSGIDDPPICASSLQCHP